VYAKPAGCGIWETHRVLPKSTIQRSAPARREFASFFEERAKQSIGGPRNYAAAIERMQLCEAQKAAQGADVAEFFAKQ
jgi:hypothetical protein